jgi:hypothetical protein
MWVRGKVEQKCSLTFYVFEQARSDEVLKVNAFELRLIRALSSKTPDPIPLWLQHVEAWEPRP